MLYELREYLKAFRNHDYRKAYRGAKEITEKQPDNKAAWHLLAKSAASLGSFKEAVEIISQTRIRFPNDIFTQRLEAFFKYRLGKYSNDASLITEAITELTKMLDAQEKPGDPSFKEGHAKTADMLAVILLDHSISTRNMEMLKQSINIWTEEKTQNPDVISAIYANLARTFYLMGQAEKAQKVIIEGLEKFKHDDSSSRSLKNLQDQIHSKTASRPTCERFEATGLPEITSAGFQEAKRRRI